MEEECGWVLVGGCWVGEGRRVRREEGEGERGEGEGREEGGVCVSDGGEEGGFWRGETEKGVCVWGEERRRGGRRVKRVCWCGCVGEGRGEGREGGWVATKNSRVLEDDLLASRGPRQTTEKEVRSH